MKTVSVLFAVFTWTCLATPITGLSWSSCTTSPNYCDLDGQEIEDENVFTHFPPIYATPPVLFHIYTDADDGETASVYIRRNSQPTSGSYDFYASDGGQEDWSTTYEDGSSLGQQAYYVSVVLTDEGFWGGSGPTDIHVTWQDAEQSMSSGVAVDFIQVQDTWSFYTLNVPAFSNLEFDIDISSLLLQEVDVYLRHGARPTTGSYDARFADALGGDVNREGYGMAQAGTWFVGVHAVDDGETLGAEDRTINYNAIFTWSNGPSALGSALYVGQEVLPGHNRFYKIDATGYTETVAADVQIDLPNFNNKVELYVSEVGPLTSASGATTAVTTEFGDIGRTLYVSAGSTSYLTFHGAVCGLGCVTDISMDLNVALSTTGLVPAGSQVPDQTLLDDSWRNFNLDLSGIVDNFSITGALTFQEPCGEVSVCLRYNGEPITVFGDADTCVGPASMANLLADPLEVLLPEFNAATNPQKIATVALKGGQFLCNQAANADPDDIATAVGFVMELLVDESTCGDGDEEWDEECDDGNTVTETCAYGQGSCTVCAADCTQTAGATSYCGDNVVDAGNENCDDGNTVTESCSYGETSCTVCSSSCTLQSGATDYCGDGVVDSGNGEGCDDGNTVTESCSYGQTSCTVCSSSCTTTAGATSYCGDGSTDSGNGENCDDSNASTESCSYGQTSCTVCTSSCTLGGGLTSFCGDGVTDSSNGENCDDGNAVTDDCPYGQGSCTVCTSSCTLGAGLVSVCGDGVVDSGAGEECDDGNTVTESCAYGETSCSVCSSTCTVLAGATSYCGDGVTNGGEGCDDGNTATETCAYGQTSCTVCASDCTNQAGATSVCGDGVTDSGNGENCDDSNAVTEDCAYGQASCTVCTSSCTLGPGMTSVCGDGVVDSGNGEGCDDGNTVTEECPYGQPSCSVCASSCTTISGAPSYCGDGSTDTTAGENCDDGNDETEYCAYNAPSCTVCTSSCILGPGIPTSCGDGFTDSSNGEECDDGNTMTESCAYGETSCVVCASDCSDQAGATSFCGDNVVDVGAGEICDDGASNSDIEADACRQDCQPAACGDQVVDTGEACDSGACCTATCDLKAEESPCQTLDCDGICNGLTEECGECEDAQGAAAGLASGWVQLVLFALVAIFMSA